MPDIEEALVERWWRPEACREATVADSTFECLSRHLFGGRFSHAEARVLSALLTGLSDTEARGLDVDEVARVCTASPTDVWHVLDTLRGAGLLHRGFRGLHPATGRRWWSWQLGGGLRTAAAGTAVVIEPTYYPDRGKIDFRPRAA